MLAGWRDRVSGTKDHQVKVQGHRIEIGEIETILEQHGGVRQAVVAAVGAPRGPRKLVAYIVPKQEVELKDDDLRDYLAARLPSYMVPAIFRIKDSLPLSSNGKVDRSALVEYCAPAEEQRATALAPGTPIEEKLAALWQETLGSTPGSVRDNFFNAGGDSVSAIKLLSKVKKTFNAEVPVRDFFTNCCIAELAEAIERQTQAEVKIGLKLAEHSGPGEYALSFAQERLWFLCQLEPESPFYNLPIAVRLKGKLNIAAFQISLNEIVNAMKS